MVAVAWKGAGQWAWQLLKSFIIIPDRAWRLSSHRCEVQTVENKVRKFCDIMSINKVHKSSRKFFKKLSVGTNSQGTTSHPCFLCVRFLWLCPREADYNVIERRVLLQQCTWLLYILVCSFLCMSGVKRGPVLYTWSRWSNEWQYWLFFSSSLSFIFFINKIHKVQDKNTKLFTKSELRKCEISANTLEIIACLVIYLATYTRTHQEMR